MNPLLESFLIEARENLKFIEENLDKLLSDDYELINSIFRAAHTLKGGSGIVGFEAVKNITHRAEDILDMLRAKKLVATKEMIDAFYDAFDEVLNLIEASEESGDIVSANSEIESAILNRLKAIAGIKEEAVSWRLPFKKHHSLEDIINSNLGALENFEIEVPFNSININENNLDQERLYVVSFDVDEDCMVFGNDPVYTLSLLKDGLILINAEISKDFAQEIIFSDCEDEQCLKLYTKIDAFVYASYSNIEEALYNFLDDLLITPIDISTLLKIDCGKDEEISFIDDLVESSIKLLHSDIDSFKSLIKDSLANINSDTKIYAKLKRVVEVITLVGEDDLSKMEQFLNSLAPNRKIKEEPKVQNVEIKNSVKILNEVDLNSIKLIYKQQLMQLENFNDTNTINRVAYIVSKVSKLQNQVAPTTRDGLLDFLKVELGEKSIETKTTNEKISHEEEKTTPKVVEKDKKDVIGKLIKVEQESIDMLMVIIGELLVAKNSLPYLADSVERSEKEIIRRMILEKYSFINRLTNQLQDLIMSMRMLPISYVFDRYPKLVRDISKKLDKKVNLIQEGGDTKLDKNMIEMLADPLIHIIRNSLDHGVEQPSVRVSKGKDEVGKIVMRAYPESDRVIIEIEDDGKGIDSNIVIRKVIEKELLSLDKIESLSEDEKIELIMLPGLSTAETISEFSGRGVGMDVVKKSIESFGGTVNIKSQLNRGTKIRLSIPVSVAVTNLLHVLMNSINYGFPMDSVSETVKIAKDEIVYLQNQPFINLRGQVIPILLIEQMLNLSQIEDIISIVVLNIKDLRLAVVVNELLGQLDVVQKPLDGLLNSHPIISGSALLGNGEIIMLLDPIGLLDTYSDLNSKKFLNGIKL